MHLKPESQNTWIKIDRIEKGIYNLTIIVDDFNISLRITDETIRQKIDNI